MIKNNIEKIKTTLWNLASDKHVSVYEIENFLRTVLIKKPLPTIPLNFENYTRCSLNNKGEIFSNIKRCSYNLDKESISLQRCNYPKQQVFYAAVPTQAKIKCIGTSIMEVTWEHISNHFIGYYFLTLSRWITKRPLNVIYFPDLKPANVFASRKDLEQYFINKKMFSNEEIANYVSLILFLHDAFSARLDKEIYYRISSAFYNCIMRFSSEENLKVDGIVYASANTDKDGTNIVLNKDLIDTGVLTCDLIQMWIGNRNSKDPTDITFLPVSESVSPDIEGNFSIEIKKEFVDLFKNSPIIDKKIIAA